MKDNLKLIIKLEDIKKSSGEDSFLGNGHYGGHEAFRAMSRGWQTAILQNYPVEYFEDFSINDIDEAIQHLLDQKNKILQLKSDGTKVALSKEIIAINNSINNINKINLPIIERENFLTSLIERKKELEKVLNNE
jgi:hypothetical protein